MNCGYAPAPGGCDCSAARPQRWHAYHIAGKQLAMAAIIAALLYRWRMGKGQRLSCAMHGAVAKCAEVERISWVIRRAPVWR